MGSKNGEKRRSKLGDCPAELVPIRGLSALGANLDTAPAGLDRSRARGLRVAATIVVLPSPTEELEDGSLDPDELDGEPAWWDEGSDDGPDPACAVVQGRSGLAVPVAGAVSPLPAPPVL